MKREMSIHIRPMRDQDALSFLTLHHAAVRGLAAKDYLPDVIECWAPMPITERQLEQVLANGANEIRLLAEIDGEIVGLGTIIIAKNELRTCYVAPRATRRGVGTALVRELERIALAHRLEWLALDASLTAEPFYAALGYEVLGRGEHVLGAGSRMACVKMGKALSASRRIR
jgi:putative acetyltransferase